MHVSSREEIRKDAADETRRRTQLPPSKETAVKKTLGVILIVLGGFGIAWGGFTYTTEEKVVEIGPVHGIFLLVAGRKE